MYKYIYMYSMNVCQLCNCVLCNASWMKNALSVGFDLAREGRDTEKFVNIIVNGERLVFIEVNIFPVM